MYLPNAFRNEDQQELAAFLNRYSFATLITWNGSESFASHLPMLFREADSLNGQPALLASHMARANPQWKQFQVDREVLVIFHGPHCYVSPTWYHQQPAVPTWNYLAVHVYGRVAIVDDAARVAQLLDQLVANYEASQERPWSGQLPDDYRAKLIGGIVAFEIEVTRMEGKWKLGQNRSADDLQAVYEKLAAHPRADERAVAEAMERYLHG